MQRFAVLNRKAMVDTILVGLRLSAAEEFTTVHNYIDTDSTILRKGAVSAKAGEKLLIPINMRDGSLICVGKGNPDWNSSAPHGAGRLMSRAKAFHELSMEQYQTEMSGIYSTCVGFYTSKSREQAVDLALKNLKIEERRIKLHNVDAVPKAWLYEYEFDLSNLTGLNVKEFLTADAEWVKFIVLNRTSKERQHNYDVVIGATANDQTLLTAQAYLSGLYGTIDDEKEIQTFLQIIEPYRLPSQFYFGTQKVAKMLDFKGRSML